MWIRSNRILPETRTLTSFVGLHDERHIKRVRGITVSLASIHRVTFNQRLHGHYTITTACGAGFSATSAPSALFALHSSDVVVAALLCRRCCDVTSVYSHFHASRCGLYICRYHNGGSAAEWLACWTRAQKGLGSNRCRDAVW